MCEYKGKQKVPNNNGCPFMLVVKYQIVLVPVLHIVQHSVAERALGWVLGDRIDQETFVNRVNFSVPRFCIDRERRLGCMAFKVSSCPKRFILLEIL